jgi:hypothetical protein
LLRKIGTVLLGLGIVGGLLGIWAWQSEVKKSREKVAAQALRDLKALVGMDATRTFVATINLNTIADLETRNKAIQLLPDLYGLTSLDIRQTPISEEQAKRIGRCSSLQSLNLNECQIEDTAVPHLCRLRNLQALYLTQIPITQRAIQNIAGLQSLKILDLSETKVTAGLEPLKSLPHLEWLLLRDLQLEKGSLAAVGACKKLARLSLVGTKVEKAELDSLKSSIPGIAID